MASNPPGYYGTIPTIQTAYQNDPRNKLAQSALALGTSTAPTAGGAWDVSSGVARAAQAIVGALVQKSQDKKYAGREQDYTTALQNAAQLASAPQTGANPAAVNPASVNPMQGAAAALAGGQQLPADPITQSGQFASGGAGMPPPSGAPAPGMPPMAPPPAQAAPMPRQAPGPMGGTPPQSVDYYGRGIRFIEGGTDPKTGAFRTSSAGAIGPGQIMPGTGPEAARLAGLKWDDTKYRTDAAYNDALGRAYYGKQLQDFGDPNKAAAAYNAGPGRVRRALRQEQAGKGEWTTHLPSETQDYLNKFGQAIGSSGQGGVQPNPVTPVAPPQMEAVPADPAPPPSAQPMAPQRPGEVQSNRIAIAQRMLASGNPDLVGIAQDYLQKGLDEQNSARTLSSQQEFQQGQTGYQADLNDHNSALQMARQDGYDKPREAEQRNFQREQTYGSQQFQANQNANNHQFEAGQSAAQRAFQDQQRRSTEQFQSSENQATRDNKLTIAQTKQGQAQANRNAYFNTPTGLKMQQEAGKEIDANNQVISKYKRFMDLNEKQTTGGIAFNTPGLGAVYGAGDPDIQEMRSFANDTTLGKIGGSLGTAISDGDRKFIEQSNISLSNNKQANSNIARATIAGLQRKNDYTLEFANAQAEQNHNFLKEWNTFVKSTPIVTYDKRGQAQIAEQPATFDEWRRSRPKYDAKGNRIN